VKDHDLVERNSTYIQLLILMYMSGGNGEKLSVSYSLNNKSILMHPDDFIWISKFLKRIESVLLLGLILSSEFSVNYNVIKIISLLADSKIYSILYLSSTNND